MNAGDFAALALFVNGFLRLLGEVGHSNGFLDIFLKGGVTGGGALANAGSFGGISRGGVGGEAGDGDREAEPHHAGQEQTMKDAGLYVSKHDCVSCWFTKRGTTLLAIHT